MNRGKLVRVIPPTPYEEVKNLVEPRVVDETHHPAIHNPLITAIGCRLHPERGLNDRFYATETVDDVDVVTCASEAIVGYGGMLVKINGEAYLGEEGAKVFYKGVHVGNIVHRGYGYWWLKLGGVLINIRKKDGLVAGKVIADIAYGKNVELRPEKGIKLDIQVGARHYPWCLVGSERKPYFGCW
jgi:hypothetical protein